MTNKKNLGGRPRQSNCDDLLQRYAKAGPEVLEWIKKHRRQLNKGNFTHENYLPPALNQSVSLKVLEYEYRRPSNKE